MRGSLLVCGTASDAGKTVLVAGICRWLARLGVAVAPFKAQNMALNAAVTPDGAEIGRAQAVQAAAAGVSPEAAMNPILIKAGAGASQIVVRGRPAFEAGARDYHARRPELLPVVLEALAGLRDRYDVVVCEGAGSPAEINLREHDLVNLGLAQAADLPVVVVADIDRGGVFASLYGTLALLEPSDQARIAGFVINRFRGDRGVLAPGLTRLAALTGRPCLGVLPWVEGLALDAEDSLALERPGPVPGGEGLSVAVVRLPRISNFTDVDALAAEPDVHVRMTASPRDVARADLVVLPGTRATVADLDWVRATGLADALAARHVRCAPTLAVCGGAQMLGQWITDPVESGAGRVPGLGLLPVTTVFEPDKLTVLRRGHSQLLGGVPAGGYEIRHGRVRVHGGAPWLVDDDGTPEGCLVGATWATTWHGLLEHDDLRRRLLDRVAAAAGRSFTPGQEPFVAVRERRLERLGDLVADHLDTAALERLITEGAPAGLPVVPPAGGPPPAAGRPAPSPVARTGGGVTT